MGPTHARTLCMRAQHGPILGLVVLCLSSLISCDQGSAFSSHPLLLVLPEAPAAWASLPGLSFEVEWRDEGGRRTRASASMGSRLAIRVGRGLPQAILASPRSRGRLLRPAGALYPEALAGGAREGGLDLLALDWLGGYEASLWLLLEGGGVDPASFDLSRLADEALLRCSDPWLVDPSEAARRLVSGSFRLSLYKNGQRFSVPLPGSTWAPESPFAQAALSSASLSAGLWRFLGTEAELVLRVDEEGGSMFIRY